MVVWGWGMWSWWILAFWLNGSGRLLRKKARCGREWLKISMVRGICLYWRRGVEWVGSNRRWLGRWEMAQVLAFGKINGDLLYLCVIFFRVFLHFQCKRIVVLGMLGLVRKVTVDGILCGVEIFLFGRRIFIIYYVCWRVWCWGRGEMSGDEGWRMMVAFRWILAIEY